MFVERFPVSKLYGAKYNPRKIDAESFDKLKESIRTIGMAKPIIATNDGLIVAGHQRTKALRSLGIEHAPVVLLDEVKNGDEIRFNQLHNGTDFDIDAPKVSIDPVGKRGFSEIGAENIHVHSNGRAAILRNEICKLIARYGSWGVIVANQNGNVLYGSHYAASVKVMNVRALVFTVKNELSDVVRKAFSEEYGVYSYDNLPRTTWAQTWAQLFRLRGGKKEIHSPTYELLAIPKVPKTKRILDFGCGQGDYVKRLSENGWQILGVEFYRRKGNKIDTKAVHGMIERLFDHLATFGLFDVVICDYVLNSVDSVQAETDVMTCLNAFCKPEGTVFYSGRLLNRVYSLYRHRHSRSWKKRSIDFLDRDGLTAIYRNGNWVFQKHHTTDQAETLGRKYIGSDAKVAHVSSTAWNAKATKTVSIPFSEMKASVEREFNLMWPGNRTVDRGDRAVEILRKFYPE